MLAVMAESGLVCGIFIFALALGIGSCTQNSSVHKLEGPAVEISSKQGPVIVTVEVARTPEQKRRGLMYREHLDEYAGMIFISNYEMVQSFWMKNTFIPLDLIFIGSDMEIKGIIENARPESEKSLSISKPSKYVLEVNGGFCSRHGVEKGQRVKLVNVED